MNWLHERATLTKNSRKQFWPSSLRIMYWRERKPRESVRSEMRDDSSSAFSVDLSSEILYLRTQVESCHTHIHTHTHTHTHVTRDAHTKTQYTHHSHSPVGSHLCHAQTHTYTHTHTHTHSLSHTHTRTCITHTLLTYEFTCLFRKTARVHTCSHRRARAQTHTHTRTHTRAHTHASHL